MAWAWVYWIRLSTLEAALGFTQSFENQTKKFDFLNFTWKQNNFKQVDTFKQCCQPVHSYNYLF